MLIQLQRPGRRRRGPVRLGALTAPSQAAVRTALARGSSYEPDDDDARVVVFDGRARHVLDAGSAPLTAVRDELLAVSETDVLPACGALAVLASLIVDADPSVQPGSFLERLGEQVAGVRPGVRGLADFASGGRDHLRGAGFRDELDDRTGGQARHFAGVAAAAARFGSELTDVAGRFVLGDDNSTADGQLTRKALEFVRLLLSGELTPRAAADWIRSELCEAGAP